MGLGAYQTQFGLGLSVSVLGLQAFQVVWDGQASEDRQTLVPHVEDGAHRLGEGHPEGVEVLGAHRVVEGQGSHVVVQQDPNAPQVGGGLDGHLLAVVADHPGVVAAA